ncbi:MAG: IS1380 family transposase [Luteolibacter sp.]
MQQNNNSTHPAACQTQCLNQPLLFQDLGAKKIVADFSGGSLSSDGGLLLLRQVDSGLGVSRLVSRCFTDARDPDLIEHSVDELVRQRLFALALGYEDLNDHADLRRDPLLAVAVGKEDVLGAERRCAKDAGFACASPATLNRLELGSNFSDRYRKVHADPQAMEDAILELGVRCLPSDSEVLILDFDATDDPLHGQQEGRFFHGYYGNYCYLPLYCFCGSVLLWAQLRMSDKDASAGTVEALKKIVAAIRRRLPHVKIVVRGDSGFAREEIMAWCEGQEDVFYLLGMARNARLERLAGPSTLKAAAAFCLTGVASRSYMETPYRTCTSWSRERRMLCKAEMLPGTKNNPRFVVTNIAAEGILSGSGEVLVEGGVRSLYEKDYCGRGNAENMIKQMVLDLKADRTSCSWMAANQMRLWFSSLAYLLLERVRSIGLVGSRLAEATLGSVRLRVMKVAAVVKVSVRRVHVALCSAFPLQEIFRQAAGRLEACAPPGPA